MSSRPSISKNGSSFDRWLKPIHDPSHKPIDHLIDEEKGRRYEKPWLELICHLNGLVKASSFNLCAIFYKKYRLKKFRLINYETFEVSNNQEFKEKLLAIANNAETLQVVHGMKGFDKDLHDTADESKIIGYRNCVIFVARDQNGNVINITKDQNGKEINI